MSPIEPVMSLIIVWGMVFAAPLMALRWARFSPLLAGMSLVAGGLVLSFQLQDEAIAKWSIAAGMAFLLGKLIWDALKLSRRAPQ